MGIEDRLARVLREAFEGAELHDLEVVPQTNRIGGVITWSGFSELEQLDRQNRLWSVLREHLAPADLRRISMIMTFTPDELQAIEEDA